VSSTAKRNSAAIAGSKVLFGILRASSKPGFPFPKGLAALQTFGMRPFTVHRAVLAEGCAKSGCVADGLAVAADGLEASDRTGDV
jgi:hypothetical protein